MISENGLRALRVAATTAFALPAIRLRIRDGERCLLHVRRPGRAPGGGPAMAPCAFRNAVARAHRLVRDGHQLQFLDLPEGHDAAIDVGLRPGDAVLPGGIYRVEFEERWIHAFATTLDPAACQELAQDDPGARAVLGFHWDDATEIALVHLETPAGCPEAALLVDEVLEPFLARCATEELLSQLTVSA